MVVSKVKEDWYRRSVEAHVFWHVMLWEHSVWIQIQIVIIAVGPTMHNKAFRIIMFSGGLLTSYIRTGACTSPRALMQLDSSEYGVPQHKHPPPLGVGDEQFGRIAESSTKANFRSGVWGSADLESVSNPTENKYGLRQLIRSALPFPADINS